MNAVVEFVVGLIVGNWFNWGMLSERKPDEGLTIICYCIDVTALFQNQNLCNSLRVFNRSSALYPLFCLSVFVSFKTVNMAHLKTSQCAVVGCLCLVTLCCRL